jgi:two-component system sensor histidine kinase/response regulator
MAADNQPLPAALPGIDIADGLRRVGNNEALYRRLLQGLARDFAGAADDIRRLNAAGSAADATRVAHSLKGIAGNLGARELFAAAAAAEQALRDSSPGASAAVDGMESALRNVLDSLAGAALTVDTPVEDTAAVLTPARVQRLPPALLAGLREATDRAELDRLEQLVAESAAIDPDLASALRERIDAFDFAALQQLLAAR